MDNLRMLKTFKTGNFVECRTLITHKCWAPYLSKSIDELSSDIFLINVEENNMLVCKSLDGISRDDILDSFKQLTSSYRSLNIPPELDLNVIHNLLWWFLVKIKSNNTLQLNLRSIFKTALESLIKVIKLHKQSVVLGLKSVQLEESTVDILNLSLTVLLHVPASVSLQLLSVITLVTLLFLRNLPELSAELMPQLNTAVDQLEMLRHHMQSFKSNGLEELYFKFGFTKANSTASMKTREEVLEAFVISASLVCAKNKQFQLALNCIEKFQEIKSSELKFLFCIIKAHCLLHLQQLTEAKVCLAYSNTAPMSPLYRAYYHYSLGLVLSTQGCHQEALSQLQAAFHSPASLSCLAAHQAAKQAETLGLSTMHLNLLKQLVQLLQEKTSENDEKGFEDVCLNLLFCHTQVSLPEALYTLSRQSYITGYHMSALNSYVELLELLKTSSLTTSQALPPKQQILHEVALAHVKADSKQEGEALCRQLIQDYVPLTDGGRKWETLLYQMEEDIVSSILLSDILAASDTRKAVDQLNRCYNMVVESREARVGEGEDGQEELCDWLLSRTLLRKARLCQDNDAVHYFRRALIHVPGDKEVMYHYKQWALWHPDHQSFDPGDKVCEFPAAQVNNLALRHILTCSISQEEWDTLFNHDSSQNVLDTLFD